MNFNEINLIEAEEIQPVKKFLKQYYDDDNTYTAHTSGSTGHPKEIRLPKAFMKASAKKTLSFLGIKPGDKTLLCISADHIGGIMMLVRWVHGDLDLYVQKPNSKPLETTKISIDFAAMVPMQLMNSIQDLSKVKKLIIGGGAINPTFEKNTNWETISTHVYHTYGMTETLSHIALRDVSKARDYFEALSNTRFSLDSRSCLVINSPDIGVFDLVTNDVVNLIDRNRFIWKGRFDNVVNSGGIKLFPEEIEKALSGLSIPYFLTGEPDLVLGSKLVLLVEGDEAQHGEEVRNAIKGLGKYQKPREILYLNQFQYTDTDKIKRNYTLKLYRNS